MQTKLNKKIMRRVYTVYALRKVLSPTMVKGYILLALLWQVNVYVSIRNVLKNFSGQEVREVHTFVFTMFTHTEVIVQVVTLGVLAVGMWLLWDVLKQWRVVSTQQILS